MEIVSQKAKIVDGKIFEVTEKEYTKQMVDERIENINEEIDMHQNEIDRLNKRLAEWESKKALLIKEVK